MDSTHLVPGYELGQPRITELRSTLTEVLGPKEAQVHVSRAVHELGLSQDALDSLSSRELLELSELLTRQRGLVSILARSFWIRLSNWEQLSESRGRA